MSAENHDDAPLNLRVCWLGGTRYTNPLDSTQDKKWRTLHDRLGIEIFVVSFSSGLRPQYFAPHAHFYLFPAIPVALLRYITFYLLAPPMLLWLIWRQGVQVVVAHDPYFGLCAVFAKTIARLFGRRVVLVVESHADFEVAVFMQRKMPMAGIIKRLMRWSAQFTLRRADVLRAVSSSTHRQLEDWSPPGIPMHQFLTWTDPDAFKQVERSVPPSQTQDLIYVGVLIPRKGIHYLLDAFARIATEFSDSHLWLAGSADNPQYAAQLVQQSEQSGLSQRVTFIGRVAQNELARYMGRSRALVLPSSSEGLPRVIIEAMLAGMPVVATCISGIPDVIQDGVNGYLVPPQDAAALESALRKVMQNPDVDRMGQQGRDFAAKFFSTEVYMDGYRRLLEDARTILTRREMR